MSQFTTSSTSDEVNGVTLEELNLLIKLISPDFYWGYNDGTGLALFRKVRGGVSERLGRIPAEVSYVLSILVIGKRLRPATVKRALDQVARELEATL